MQNNIKTKRDKKDRKYILSRAKEIKKQIPHVPVDSFPISEKKSRKSIINVISKIDKIESLVKLNNKI